MQYGSMYCGLSRLFSARGSLVRPQADTSRTDTNRDDKLTLVAISTLAGILRFVLHEGCGHGIAAWLSGSNRITLRAVGLESDLSTAWISASGPLASLVAAAVFGALLRRRRGYAPAVRYFLTLGMIGNLFVGTGYFLISGVAGFGDWAEVMRDLQLSGVWRVALIVLGLSSYSFAMLLAGAELEPFDTRSDPSRLRLICWIPLCTGGILAVLGSALNPLGALHTLAWSLPSVLGADFGLLTLPGIVRRWGRGVGGEVESIPFSAMWVGTSAAAALLFTFVLGRGLTWSR